LKKVAFSVDQEAENDFKVNSTTWNIAFWLHQNRILGWSSGRKWVRSALQTL